MLNPEEMWQAEVNGQIYDASFGELTQWIAQDSLIKNDKVRRGELRWLEAGKVPQLKDFFNAKENGTSPPYVHVNTTVGNETKFDNPAIESKQNISENKESSDQYLESNSPSPPILSESTQNSPGTTQEISMCEIHSEIESAYICNTCSHSFCYQCVQGDDKESNNCPYCGALCQQIYNELKNDNNLVTDQNNLNVDNGIGAKMSNFCKGLFNR